ncbi:Asp-tRNAAsn/Glu-tRNAGln amidotransferase A subunit [Roseivivax lentus]|uniref:Asp-tRNAAsn/Glu-tRNAGln amidotransferase A subunit n=1 Tax=Roseivivax lentus TaxID=633194 RepID=A0A1N7P0N5_9RHOB|nr:amidase [Roseivivax lentus]SIT04118.1 Asp-tRNAAsn/Glu-tRNAGln amidotransferase A subunit [Roseivivax lentus]
MTGATQDMPGAVETALRIAEGRSTALKELDACLERIDATEDDIGAWVALDRAGARDMAAALDARGTSGLLHGIPMAVKDIFAVKGMPWRCGSPIWKDRVATFDAGSVALARAAGAVLVGKTETTEFASYNPARTRNPHNPARTPGGSSSGSAAAVAAGMVPLAFGTQTSGSIIRPASYCGVVGFKPSFDLIEPGGVAPLARSLDTIGLFARSVADVALGVTALTGIDLAPEPATDRAEYPLDVSAAWDDAEPALRTAWAAFTDSLAPAGRQQNFPTELTAALRGAADLHGRIMDGESAEALAFEHATAPDLLSDKLRAHLEAGRALSGAERAADWAAMRRLRAMMDATLAPDAVWLTPAATGPAPAIESGTGSPAFNRIWTLLGLPCCTVPILRAEDGMPMGVQVVGAMGNDRGVLQMAHDLMARYGAAG